MCIVYNKSRDFAHSCNFLIFFNNLPNQQKWDTTFDDPVALVLWCLQPDVWAEKHDQ
jgi:hypothetical protein